MMKNTAAPVHKFVLVRDTVLITCVQAAFTRTFSLYLLKSLRSVSLEENKSNELSQNPSLVWGKGWQAYLPVLLVRVILDCSQSGN